MSRRPAALLVGGGGRAEWGLGAPEAARNDGRVVIGGPESALLDWLLDTDVSLRWQVERDLVGAPETAWSSTRARVATEGYGAALLAEQDADGQWAGGAYFPGDYRGPDPRDDGGQPYTATTWSLNALREWGVDPAVLAGTAEKLAANSRWEYDDLPYWDGEVDACVNAYTLANGAWLGADVSRLARWFIDHQLADGGWNCDWVEGSTRSSFHSTINALAGLLCYEEATGGDALLRATRRAGEEYLLRRRLTRTLSTGALVGPWVSEFAYPFRWPYSVVKAVDYFRAAALRDGTSPDPRMAEAIDIIRRARRPDGTWIQQKRHPGRVWTEVDVPPGQPSPWLTFYAARALAWWDGAVADDTAQSSVDP